MGAMPSLLLALLLLLLVHVGVVGGFLLPHGGGGAPVGSRAAAPAAPAAPASTRIACGRPRTAALFSFLPFRDEPWFTHDTVHVSEGGDEIVIETRAPPPPKAEPEAEEAVVAASSDDEQEGEDDEGQGGAEARRQGAPPKGPPQEYKVGIIVVDHGSRRREANEALHQVVENFKAVSGFELVEAAHMELAEPSIATAFGRCVEQGATFILCHPYFLSRGRHVTEDIPTLMEEAASIFPGVGWALSQPLGLQAEIPRLMQLTVSQALEEQGVASEDHNPLYEGLGL